jgi:hypothetical protein
VNEARTFLESINYKTGSADVIIAPKIRFINVMKNYKTTQKQVNGFVMSPAPEGNVGGLLGSKGFKSDLYNSGDGTFRSSSAYISKSLICINDAERVNPKGDVTKCDESAKSPCYTKTELFCAALDQ